jgi:hypothetical protein
MAVEQRLRQLASGGRLTSDFFRTGGTGSLTAFGDETYCQCPAVASRCCHDHDSELGNAWMQVRHWGVRPIA